jgi:hypothetical protein
MKNGQMCTYKWKIVEYVNYANINSYYYVTNLYIT